VAVTATAGRIAPRASTPAPLPFAESVCLVLITQKVSHGWALGSMLAPDGELGRIWALSRPLTYRAIDGLVDKGLITRTGPAAGRGRDRVLLAPTGAGRRRARKWLEAPVEHLRDVRTELLVKLFLRDRAGLDNEPLLARQAERFAPAIDALIETHRDDDLVDLWRRESARAVRRFLAQAVHPAEAPGPRRPELRVDARDHLHGTGTLVSREGRAMQLSARNQLRATVDTVTHGEVMSTVRVTLPDGQHVTAAITKDAAEDLGLAVGDDVIVVIKSTEVMLAKE
jgi:PadR family transcriptional regulator AphA